MAGPRFGRGPVAFGDGVDYHTGFARGTFPSRTRGETVIPYGRQCIDEDDVAAVAAVLRSDWLTTGPTVAAFEAAVSARMGAAFGCAVANGTAALHSLYHALGVGPGDEVIVPTITFAATANAALYVGATPVFADVDPDDLTIDPASVERLIGPKTKLVVGVDYAGQPCDYDALGALCRERGVELAADSCHALGATYKGRPLGEVVRALALSFHPVKHIATGEGGMIVSNDEALVKACAIFRNHGVTTDFRQREQAGLWSYDMAGLGYNYRLSDIHAALGLSQLKKLDRFLARRREIAAAFDAAFAGLPFLKPLARRPERGHAWHLYVVRIDFAGLGKSRRELFQELRGEGIGVNVHYLPTHLHSHYRTTLGTGEGLCPVAEAAYETLLTLPIHPGMTDVDVQTVVSALQNRLSRVG